jgi:hypothetical protein
MSRAQAELLSRDGHHIAWGIYCGTSDVLMPFLCADSKTPWDVFYEGRQWRADGANYWDVLAACKHAPESAYVWSDYGGGFHWPVDWCPTCMVIRGPLDWDSIYDDLGPAWPKDGRPPIDA